MCWKLGPIDKIKLSISKNLSVKSIDLVECKTRIYMFTCGGMWSSGSRRQLRLVGCNTKMEDLSLDSNPQGVDLLQASFRILPAWTFHWSDIICALPVLGLRANKWIRPTCITMLMTQSTHLNTKCKFEPRAWAQNTIFSEIWRCLLSMAAFELALLVNLTSLPHT